MIAVIYAHATSDWECEKCNAQNEGLHKTCQNCKAPRFPSAAPVVNIPTTTRMYREPRETGFNFMPVTTLALVLGTILAICLFLYWWLG